MKYVQYFIIICHNNVYTSQWRKNKHVFFWKGVDIVTFCNNDTCKVNAQCYIIIIYIPCIIYNYIYEPMERKSMSFILERCGYSDVLQ